MKIYHFNGFPDKILPSASESFPFRSSSSSPSDKASTSFASKLQNKKTKRSHDYPMETFITRPHYDRKTVNSPIQILQRRNQREDLLPIAVDRCGLIVEQIQHLQRLELIQRLQLIEILDLIAGQVQMRQLGAGRQMAETAGYPIVGQFEFLQVGQCREALQRGQADIDKAERFQGGEIVGEADNAGAAAIVQNEFGDLRTCVVLDG